jgi:hypothetical protein
MLRSPPSTRLSRWTLPLRPVRHVTSTHLRLRHFPATPRAHAAARLAPEPLTAMLLKRASALNDGTTAEHAAAAVHSANAVEVAAGARLPRARRPSRLCVASIVARAPLSSVVSSTTTAALRATTSTMTIRQRVSSASTTKLTHAASVSPPPCARAGLCLRRQLSASRHVGASGGAGALCPRCATRPPTLPPLPPPQLQPRALQRPQAAASAASKAHAIERRRARPRQQKLHAYQKNRLRRVSDSVLDIAMCARRWCVRPRRSSPRRRRRRRATATSGILPHSPAPHLPRLIDTPISPKKRLLKVVSERQMPGGVPALLDEASNRTDSDSDNDTVFSTETEDGHHTDVDDTPPVPRSAAMPIAGAAEALTDIPDDDNMLRHMSAPSPQTLIASSPAVPHRTHTTSPPPPPTTRARKPTTRRSNAPVGSFGRERQPPKAAPAPQRSLSQSLEMPAAPRGGRRRATVAVVGRVLQGGSAGARCSQCAQAPLRAQRHCVHCD